jgi:hypothetical protein
VKLFVKKKSPVFISILLITCFLIVGCGNKTSVSKTPYQSEEGQEASQKEATIDHIQEDPKKAESIDTPDFMPNVEDSKKSPVTDSDVSRQGQENVNSQGQEQEKSDDPEQVSSVTVSIVGPEDNGVIMKATVVEIEEGETVLDVLRKAARQNNIPISVRGRKSTAYVEGIDNLFEFDHGAKSGWLYRVNGSMYSQSAGSFTVKPDDVIEWLYTLDMGRDIDDDTSYSGGAADE